MLCVVTGCAGFIGSHLTDRLLAAGHKVIGIDNFSTGKKAYLTAAQKNADFKLIQADILDKSFLIETFCNVDTVFHFAANADVRFGPQHPGKDLEQNTIGTANVLEAMRLNQCRRIIFASTGSVYGEASVIPTPETAPFPIQTSLYGASKLAAEGLISAYSAAFAIQAFIFRFVSLIGERYSHGHLYDFHQQLLSHPDYLNVLGNGLQRKSYLYVHDCLDAVLLTLDSAFVDGRVNIFNLGTPEYCTVNDSIHWLSDYLKLQPQINYSGGERGWIGDNPFIFLALDKMTHLGWKPKYTIKEGMMKTLQYLHYQGNRQIHVA